MPTPGRRTQVPSPSLHDSRHRVSTRQRAVSWQSRRALSSTHSGRDSLRYRVLRRRSPTLKHKSLDSVRIDSPDVRTCHRGERPPKPLRVEALSSAGRRWAVLHRECHGIRIRRRCRHEHLAPDHPRWSARDFCRWMLNIPAKPTSESGIAVFSFSLQVFMVNVCCLQR